jgi:hypothetical protein
LSTYEWFLQDLVKFMKEEINNATGKPDSTEYERGIAFGWELALDLIRNQAIAFQLPLEPLGLAEEIF